MKSRRQAKIIDIVSRYEIETQEELLQRLGEEGFRVTQATVSRDVRQLNLTKISSDNGRQKYAVISSLSPHMSDKYLRVLRDGFVNMDSAGNILVIRTGSGMAMAVAAALDEMGWREVAGCIAGDDTIFCATHSQEETAIVMEMVRRIVL